MKPNILLVTIDSLRADAVSGQQPPTPTLETIGDQSHRYDAAFTQAPFTTFSMPSLFTSRYPSGLAYLEFSESTVGVYIDDETTLPGALRDDGYETAGFHSNPLLSNLFGFDRGFNTFDAQLPFSNTDALPGRAKILADKLFRLVRKHPYLPAETVNERALEWLADCDGDRPFFLWVHYMDVHGPYITKEGNHYLNKYRGERLWRKGVTRPEDVTDAERTRLRELYQEEVEYTDTQLGELFEGLRAHGCWDETIVVVTADHGEAFGEHGAYSHPHQLYDELTHVPLLVRAPERDAGTVESPVELLDLAPTLLDHAGVAVPDGFSGRPLVESQSAVEAAAISEADIVPAYNGSIRTERYRYIRNDVANREELYDVQADPAQEHNLINEQLLVREELAARIEAHLTTPGRNAGGDRTVRQANVADTAVEDRLEDLGYLE